MRISGHTQRPLCHGLLHFDERIYGLGQRDVAACTFGNPRPRLPPLHSHAFVDPANGSKMRPLRWHAFVDPANGLKMRRPLHNHSHTFGADDLELQVPRQHHASAHRASDSQMRRPPCLNASVEFATEVALRCPPQSNVAKHQRVWFGAMRLAGSARCGFLCPGPCCDCLGPDLCSQTRCVFPSALGSRCLVPRSPRHSASPARCHWWSRFGAEGLPNLPRRSMHRP